jgi:hypothetical protein
LTCKPLCLGQNFSQKGVPDLQPCLTLSCTHVLACPCSGLSLTAKIARQEGGGIRDWLSPSLHIHVEPLGLL